MTKEEIFKKLDSLELNKEEYIVISGASLVVQDIIDDKETEDTKDYTTVKYTVKPNETIEDIAFKNCITTSRLLEFNKPEDIKPGNEINIPVRDIVKLMYKVSKVMENKLHKLGKIDFESS